MQQKTSVFIIWRVIHPEHNPVDDFLAEINSQVRQDSHQELKYLNIEYQEALKENNPIWISQVTEGWWRTYTQSHGQRISVPKPNITPEELAVIKEAGRMPFYVPAQYTPAENMDELLSVFGIDLATDPQGTLSHNKGYIQKEGWYLLELHPEKHQNRPILKTGIPSVLTLRAWLIANMFYRDIHSKNNSFLDQEGSIDIAQSRLVIPHPQNLGEYTKSVLFAKIETSIDDFNVVVSTTARYPVKYRSLTFIPDDNYTGYNFNPGEGWNGPGGTKHQPPAGPRPGGRMLARV